MKNKGKESTESKKYKLGENQKIVTKSYRDNWNVIFTTNTSSNTNLEIEDCTFENES